MENFGFFTACAATVQINNKTMVEILNLIIIRLCPNKGQNKNNYLTYDYILYDFFTKFFVVAGYQF